MPSIQPSQLRTLAKSLSNDGVLNRADVNQLIQTAVGDATLTPELKSELQDILETYADKIDSTQTRNRLKNFLSISDPALQAESFRLERDDGAISLADAQKLIDLAGADGSVSTAERFSLGAVLVGSKLSDEARTKLKDAAGITEQSFKSSPGAAIPDNDATGISDKINVTADGVVADLSVSVDLDHTWKGDLRLKLTSPDGQSVFLHDKAGRSGDDIKGTFGKDLTAAEDLTKLLGGNAKGEWTLHVTDHAGQDVGKLNNWSLNVATTKAPDETDAAKPMDPTGQHRPVFLTDDGFFVSSAGAGKPQNNADLGTGLFRMADLIDDVTVNPFTSQNLTVSQREAILGNLQSALAKVPPGGPNPSDMSDIQAKQMRSSVATVMLALIESLGNNGEDATLKNEAFMAYRGALNAETNPVLKDSMIWNLVAMKDQLAGPMKAKVEDIHETIAPSSPPYDDWFKDGNTDFNIAWTNGPDPEFFPGTMLMLGKAGFTKVDPNDTTAPVIMTKTFSHNGVDTKVNITVDINRGDKMFKEMDNEDVHMVGYDGHSNFGRNVPASLARGTDEKGKKLIMTGLCAGKDSISRTRERYPDSQLLTSFNSSYFRTSQIDGKKVMTQSENVSTLLQVIEGVSRRADWEDINTNIKSKGVWSNSHVMPGGNNYISPVHTLIRRRVLDSDHDGQADVLDKLVHFDTQKVSEDSAREFSPIDAGRPADMLDGTRTHIAAMGINTATGYNTHTQKWKKQNVIGAGYFEPSATEANTVLKYEPTKIDGQDVMLMKVNKNFAHMSIEALRAVGGYQLMMDGGEGRRWDGDMSATDRKLMSLTFAAALLEYDSGSWGRDPAVWKGMLAALNLPAELDLRSLSSLIGAEHHDYTGSLSIVRKWKENITPETLAKLADPTVGVPS